MAGFRDLQNSFNAGELSPIVFGRGEIPAYQSGLQKSENWIILKPGGLERRPGTVFTALAFDQAVASRLIRFHVSQVESFALEFSTGFFRVFTDSGILVLATWTLDAISDVDLLPEELIILNHGYYDGAGPFRLVPLGTGTLPPGLATGQDYYCDLPRIATITLASAATDVLTAVNNYTLWQGPFRISTSGSLPAGLNTSQDYYVRDVTPTSFKLATTVGGVAVNITSAGSGNQTLKPTSSFLRNRMRLRSTAVGGAIIPINAAGTGLFEIVPQGNFASRFAHAFSPSQIADIDHAQSGDIMYLTHQQVPPQKVTRFSNQSWQSEEVDLFDGPYLLDQETFPLIADASIKMTPTALTGTGIVMTATKGIFVGTDVGRVIRYAPEADPLKWGWAKIVGVNPITFLDTDFTTFVATIGEWNTGSDQIDNGLAHNIQDGEPITFSVTDGGVTAGLVYWAHRINANSLSVHLTQADALADTARVNLIATASNQTVIGGWINKTAHGITSRIAAVTLATSGTLPPGLSLSATYVVDAPNANSLQLSIAGAAVVPTALTGSGTHSINGSTLPSTTCLMDIKEDFITGSASELWRLGSFGRDPRLGFPRAVTFHEQRLVFGGTVAEAQTLFFSQSGDFESFTPDEDDGTGDHLVTKASGLVLSIGSDVASRILWLTPLRVLVVGCLDGPWVLQAPISEAISAIDLPVTRRQAKVGIGPQKPAAKSVALIFTSHSPGYAYGAAFDVDQDAIVPNELMVLASHLADYGAITQLAESGAPLDVVWMVRADGELLALTFDPVQEITAWTRFKIGATLAGPSRVESVATTAEITEGEQLWLVVAREVNGQTVRSIEYMAPRFRTTTPQADGHFVDSGVDVILDPPGTVVTGLSHLEGETVDVLADGAKHPPLVVTGGQVTLDADATRVHVGLRYASLARMLPAELPASARSQIAMVKKKIVNVMMRFHRTLGLQIGPTEASLALVDFRTLYGDPIGAPVALRSGVVEIPVGGVWGRDGDFAFGSSDPLPCQVLSVLERLEWSDR